MRRFHSDPSRIIICRAGLIRGVPRTGFKMFAIVGLFATVHRNCKAECLDLFCGARSNYYFQVCPGDGFTKHVVQIFSVICKVSDDALKLFGCRCGESFRPPSY